MRAAAILTAVTLMQPAYADNNCNKVGLEVELAPAAMPFSFTISHDCIKADTIIQLHPVSPTGSRIFWWQEFPNIWKHTAVINHSVTNPDGQRYIATFRTLEIEQ